MPQKLAEWLVLTEEETLSLKPLLPLITTYTQRRTLSEGEKAEALRYLSTLDLALLIKHALRYPEAGNFYKQPGFKAFWDKQWEDCSKEFLSTTFEFVGKPQATLSSFELLKGVFLYARYKKIRQEAKNKDEEKIAEEYLDLSANSGFFTAIILLFKLNLADDKTPTSFFYAQQASSLYLSPGYLLQAYFYYQRGFYLEALKNFILAKKLAPYSEIFIHNAYTGLPIESIIQPFFSSWEEGIQKLAGLAKLPMPFVVKHIYPQLDKEVEVILSSIPKELEDSMPTTLPTLTSAAS